MKSNSILRTMPLLAITFFLSSVITYTSHTAYATAKGSEIKLGPWKVSLNSVKHNSSITSGIDTYRGKPGSSFLILNLRFKPVKPKQTGTHKLEINLKKLAIRVGKNKMYLSQGMGTDSSIYFYAPLLAGKMPADYSCSNALGDKCNPLAKGTASQTVGEIKLEVKNDGNKATASITAPLGKEIEWQIVFYVPEKVNTGRLHWPGQAAIKF